MYGGIHATVAGVGGLPRANSLCWEQEDLQGRRDDGDLRNRGMDFGRHCGGFLRPRQKTRTPSIATEVARSLRSGEVLRGFQLACRRCDSTSRHAIGMELSSRPKHGLRSVGGGCGAAAQARLFPTRPCACLPWTQSLPFDPLSHYCTQRGGMARLPEPRASMSEATNSPPSVPCRI